MSIREQVEELDVDVTAEEIANRISRETVPGPENDWLQDGIVSASQIMPLVVEDLNNWFYAIDLRVLDDTHIGIPMRYRWTIIRWAKNDMDSWLDNNGWNHVPHLNADSRTRQENELEARYRKNYGDITVDCNFLVEFPEVVFRKMNEGDLDRLKKQKKARREKRNSLEEIIEARRG